MWFESLLSFLVKRHPEKWEDEDLATSEFELRKISDKLRELASLASTMKNPKKLNRIRTRCLSAKN